MNTNKPKPFGCSECDKKFQSATGLYRHENLHKGVSFKCPLCDARFVQKGGIAYHMTRHTGEKPFKCEQCLQCFTRKSCLKGHLQTQHSAVKPIYPCMLCDKKFQSKTGLTFHLRKHTGERPYKCEICNERFQKTEGLRRHQFQKQCRSLNDACAGSTCTDVASKPSQDTSKSRLRKTMPFKKRKVYKRTCIFCEKIFSTTSGFETHLRLHLGEKPETCNDCSEEFYCKKHLSYHKELGKCNQTAIEEQQHKESELPPPNDGPTYHVEHPQPDYQCGICNEMLREKPALLDHLAKHKQTQETDQPHVGKTNANFIASKFTKSQEGLFK